MISIRTNHQISSPDLSVSETIGGKGPYFEDFSI